MKYSLGLWLALCLAGLQFVAVTIVVSSSYVTSERVLLEHANGLLSDVGANTAAHSKGFLDPARSAAELAARLAENKIVSSDDSQLLERLLFQQLQAAPQFAGVFYGDEMGNFVYVNRSEDIASFRSKIIRYDQGVRETDLTWRDLNFQQIQSQPDPTDTYDPRARPWYQEAKANRESIWTDPYIFFTSQRPGITIASPVIDADGSVQGVIGVDIEISAISEFLTQLKIGENGTALIVNKNGDVIAHPRPALLKAENADGTFRFVGIDEIADPIARAAFSGSFSNDTLSVAQVRFSQFRAEDQDYVSLIMPDISSELPWTIAVYAPESDFIGPIKENRFSNILIAGAIAIVTALVGLLIANYIYQPVRAFAVRASLISQGEIDPAAPMPKTYTELNQANEALMQQIKQRKASEHEYGQTFDMASRGMAQMDAKTGGFLRVNTKFAAILGYTPEEMLHLQRSDLTHPDDPTLSWEFSESGLEDHAINLEKKCQHKDGHAVWVKMNAIVIRDSDGNALHAVTTIDEITQARAAEEKIHKLNRDLSHLARGELLGQMAAGLAHELNQPLTAITQNVDAALLTAAENKNPDPELIHILKDLDQQAHRAGDIIKALREFIRKGEELKESFDINELMTQSSRLVQAEATEHGVTITDQSSALPHVTGIRVQIAQVMVNLLHNAIESIAQSGSTQKHIRIAAINHGHEVEFTITDSGPGVDGKIDLFGQFETTKNAGMGLGLSICRSIIETGGGKMWHDETFQDGARFCFTVPTTT